MVSAGEREKRENKGAASLCFDVFHSPLVPSLFRPTRHTRMPKKRDLPGDASHPAPKAPARGARRGMPLSPSAHAPAADDAAPSSAAPPTTTAPSPPATLGGLVDRREYVRLLQQTLSDDLGLPTLASALAAATGVAAEERPAAALRTAAGEGDWEEVPRLVASLGGGARGARAARWVAAREAVLEVRGVK